MSAPISVPPSVPDAAEQARAADHRRRDGVELVHHPGDGLRGVQPRGQQSPPRPRWSRPESDVDHRLVEPHADARQPGRFLVAADA